MKPSSLPGLGGSPIQPADPGVRRWAAWPVGEQVMGEVVLLEGPVAWRAFFRARLRRIGRCLDVLEAARARSAWRPEAVAASLGAVGEWLASVFWTSPAETGVPDRGTGRPALPERRPSAASGRARSPAGGPGRRPIKAVRRRPGLEVIPGGAPAFPPDSARVRPRGEAFWNEVVGTLEQVASDLERALEVMSQPGLLARRPSPLQRRDAPSPGPGRPREESHPEPD